MTTSPGMDLVVGSGVVDGMTHRLPIRVYYEDTDAGGIVYHANYLRFAERARSELLRLIGWGHEHLIAEYGLGWVVRRLDVDYRRPARLGDDLTVVTSLTRLQGASVEALQRICRGAEELVRIKLQLVLLTAAGRPGRLPAGLRDALQPFQPP
ncbi:MAG TPA: tol-pal system-associated acyl-CoA thioesterase [Stellaceae bacterium]|nr:tol-pal system-associated acyl-CoA thioesterase [Stellaceae bacterium]